MTVLKPPGGSFELAFGRFGPCVPHRDPDTRVGVVACKGAKEGEDIFFNFFLPGIWMKDTFTAGGVATMLEENATEHFRRPRVENSFQYPDPVTGQPAFFLALTALHADDDCGQAVLTIVAPLAGAVYSMTYSRVFCGPAEPLRAKLATWFEEHGPEYAMELGTLRADESWIAYLKGQGDWK